MSLIDIEICQVTAAYARVREAIMNADLLPNTQHDVAALAARFNLNPDDVILANRRLENEGLIWADQGDSFCVLPMAAGEVIRLHRRITSLEALAVELAALLGAPPICLRALDDAVTTMEDAEYRGDIARWAKADHHFHRSLVQCSDNSRLISSALQLSEPLHRARMMALRVHGLPITAHEYRDVVTAIRRGWTNEARDLHRAQWQRASMMTVTVLEQHGLDIISL